MSFNGKMRIDGVLDAKGVERANLLTNGAIGFLPYKVTRNIHPALLLVCPPPTHRSYPSFRSDIARPGSSALPVARYGLTPRVDRLIIQSRGTAVVPVEEGMCGESKHAQNRHQTRVLLRTCQDNQQSRRQRHQHRYRYRRQPQLQRNLTTNSADPATAPEKAPSWQCRTCPRKMRIFTTKNGPSHGPKGNQYPRPAP